MKIPFLARRPVCLATAPLGIVVLTLLCTALCTASVAQAQNFVPGTGHFLPQVGDDFEDPEWSFKMNWPKSSRNIDDRTRNPTGISKNRRWYEGVKRGMPDHIRRVETPEGGLEGSEGALLLQSMLVGMPKSHTYKMQQDDFIADVKYILRGAIPASRSPSVVTRVYVPPFDQWEERNGCSFAFRAALEPRFPRPKSRENWNEPDTYWPGFLIDFQSKEKGHDRDAAFIRVRARSSGADYRKVEIKETGWWTFGMSFSPDGYVHYYVKKGVEDLTAEDHIASHLPYGSRMKEFNTFFFNVCSYDDGKTWSTPWIVDDPSVYVRR
ncbi:MAG: hypothetical protein DWQ31_06500 [Planctomycetota bacterium]|nr:MAG: hypothetical protein DWQ31_06500 [Planctomycetota bacterium]REJ91499.1 MAG: hypothetical protein DWQ35_14235 [Planctomycetota bacterium]REK26953.1 MAG: hypothetical protein DWQ42_07790 [Planctomycetota bacterium]REK44368.1 MAG: hypothetical protein DWQ46_09895 [Planctomycetota bacterium]